MRVLVCGGRDFKDTFFIERNLEHIWTLRVPITGPTGFRDRNPMTVITGGAKGVDTIAAKWAEKGYHESIVFPAQWETYGKRAGYIRNKQMLDEGKPDLVIAFPGGRGTEMMVRLAREANVEVIEVG